jgi:hypothetical protein
MRRWVAVLFFACTSSAWAQFSEFWFSAGQSLLSNSSLGSDQAFGGSKNDVQLTDGFRFGFRATFNTTGIFGHEVQYAYSRTQLRFNDQGGLEQGMAIHQGGYNFLVYGTHEGKRVRPFATGGFHFANFVPPGSSAASGGGDTKVGLNYGGGVKFRVMSIFALRFDVRQYTSPKPFDLPLKGGWLRQTEVSAGFGVVF